MKKLISKIVFLSVMLFSVSANTAVAFDDNMIITSPVAEFTKIKIVGENSEYHRGWYGYGGIWIEKTDDSWAGVAYNPGCEGFVSAEVEDDTLILTVNCEFLRPGVWNRSNGWVEAIRIKVPERVKLESIINEGQYLTNTTLIGFNQHSLSITSSNTTYLMNCQIKNLSWKPLSGRPLAAMCGCNISFEATNVYKLILPETCIKSFKANITLGSRIKNFYWTK